MLVSLCAQRYADKDYALRTAAFEHKDREEELERKVEHMKKARDGLYAADRLQQKKFGRILGTIEHMSKEVQAAEAATKAASTALKMVPLKKVPPQLLGAAAGAATQVASAASRLAAARKEVEAPDEAPMVASLKGVRESHAKHAGYLMWGKHAKADLY